MKFDLPDEILPALERVRSRLSLDHRRAEAIAKSLVQFMHTEVWEGTNDEFQEMDELWH